MMTIPDQLGGLNRVSLGDQAKFVAAATTSNQKSWLYYFPFLYSFSLSADRTLLWELRDGAICLYFLRRRDDGFRMDLYLPPFPFSAEAMGGALERANSFNGKQSCRITWVAEHQRAAVEGEGFRVRAIEEEFVYDGELVKSLSGKNFHRLRRNLNKARRIPGMLVREYRQDDQEPCRQLFRRWRRFLRDEKGVNVQGYSYMMNCIESASSFEGDTLKGEVITVADRVRAFTFGGRISSSHGSLFVAISDHGVPGLGYLQRFSLMASSSDIRYFNDSSDVGRAGLADVKNSFNPVEMHSLYRAYPPESVRPV